jgi:hypothetical protein
LIKRDITEYLYNAKSRQPPPKSRATSNPKTDHLICLRVSVGFPEAFIFMEENNEELEDDMIIFDAPEEGGIEFLIKVSDRYVATVFLSDEQAERMIRIVENKLNGRKG